MTTPSAPITVVKAAKDEIMDKLLFAETLALQFLVYLEYFGHNKMIIIVL